MEDSLRMNVLLNQELQALRIDESKMVVYGLSPKGEATVQLNPNCRDEHYIKKVKEVVSAHVLGSPGGYPVYLRRWTRMGQAKDESLEKLLQLGEPEAVVAVVHASGMTDEIARRAWWAMPNSQNARCLLENETVVQGEMGRVLAEFLLEFLPFEEEAKDIVNSVRLVLQGELITEEEKQDLWNKGQRKNAFLVGFLHSLPDELYEQAKPHPAHEDIQPDQSGEIIALLNRVLSEKGQAFLKTVLTVMKKPVNQDVVIALMNAIGDYFSAIRQESFVDTDDLEEVKKRSESALTELANSDNELGNAIKTDDALKSRIYAMLYLSQLCEKTTNPVFSRTDAIGTVMRKKLEPVFEPVIKQINVLYGAGK